MAGNRKIDDYRRSPRFQQIPIKQLVIDEKHLRDDHFIRLYLRLQRGKLSGVYTRIDVDKIIPGFFRLGVDAEPEYISAPVEKEHVGWLAAKIRQGLRPTIHLYKGFVGQAKDRFICSDDLVVFNAYRSLGIRRIPALVLGRHPELMTEAGFCIRIEPRSQKGCFVSAFSNEPEACQAVLGDAEGFRGLDILAGIDTLDALVQRAERAIREFHLPSDNQEIIHYHHTLYSVVSSLLQTIRAVRLLIECELSFQIRPLVRSAYDLMLNFYVDWIAPEKTGGLLQAVAILSRGGRTRQECRDIEKELKNVR